MIDVMTQCDPAKRPEAVDALRQWRVARGRVPFIQRRWRLRLRDEPFLLSLGGDNLYLMTRAVHWITGSKYTNNLLQE